MSQCGHWNPARDGGGGVGGGGTSEAITDTVAVGTGVGVGGGANGGKASSYGGMEANPAIPPPLRGETGSLAASA